MRFPRAAIGMEADGGFYYNDGMDRRTLLESGLAALLAPLAKLLPVKVAPADGSCITSLALLDDCIYPTQPPEYAMLLSTPETTGILDLPWDRKQLFFTRKYVIEYDFALSRVTKYPAVCDANGITRAVALT